MRVHSLVVTGFGPFADTVRVDLDALSQDGLFLLCGRTGAGKTSLLDAIAFALYGRVPGARGQEKRLRSDHARAEVRTEVVCELTLRGERVRVTRRPEQIRSKARGTGTTKDQALLHVQRQVAGAWEPVSIRLDEGSEYLHGQVGLSAEQFWQVVLLPQGEFAEFLRAEPDQRAKVLETLFDSGRFADAETWLADHARSLAASQHSAEQVVDRLVHRVEQAVRGLSSTESGAQPDLESGADLLAMPADQDPEVIRHYLVRQLSRARAQLELAGNEDEATMARLGAAETGRDRARQAVRAVERLLHVHRQADFLQLRSDDLAEQRLRLAAALAAEPLRPFLDAEAEAATRCCETADALAESYADLLGSDPDERRPVRLSPLDHSASGGGASVRGRSGPTRSAAKGSASVGSADPVSAPEELELVTVSGSVTAVPELRRWGRILRAEVTRLADLESDQAVVDTDERRLAELVQAQT
ncbi:MAG: SMC family ATPase, partial [Actinomycetota bacterium]|nr:SMC family ATPase [Actinomycetota bacterium]